MRDANQHIPAERLLDLLSHVGQIVSSAKNLDTILYATVSLIKTMLDVERCSVLIMDPQTHTLRMKAASNIPSEEWDSIRIPLGEGICGAVARDARPLLVEDVDTSPYSGQSPRGRYSTSSFICVPLLIKGRAVGVINANNRNDNARFSREHLELMTALAGFLALSIDNSRLFMASEGLRTHLENTIESLPAALFSVDLSHRVTLCNGRFSRLLGTPENSPLEGRTVEEVLPAALRSRAVPMIDETAEYGISGTGEMNYSAPSGNVEIEISTVPLTDTHGGIDGVLVTITDISVRREIMELRRIDEMKTNFISMVSHELRTPLTSIKGAVHLLGSSSGEGMTPKQNELIALIDGNADRLARLVNNILDVVNIENNTMSIVRKPEDIRAMVETCIASFQPAALKKGVLFAVDLEACTAVIDRDRIYQAVNVLLDNALKFTPRAGKVYVTLAQRTGTLRLSVRDTGCGISPEARRGLFTKFYQSENPLTRKTGGSGIGLYIARAIVQLHGGSIIVGESTDVGAEFLIVLPQAQALDQTI